MVDDIRAPYARRRDYTQGVIGTKPIRRTIQKDANEQPSQQNTIARKEHPTRSSHKVHKRLLIILTLICVCLGAAGLFFSNIKHGAIPFPTTIASGLNYPAYYAIGSTSGYTYKSDSAKIKAGILFYTMANRTKYIFITEQNAPSTAINLSSLPKHTALSVPIGQAVIGTGLGNPSIVIVTPSTLIELTSNKGVTKTDIISIAQKMVQQN
jgi:hypothetical protein